MRRLLVVVFCLSLIGCGNDELDKAQETSTGVIVTDNVPFAHEPIQDIIDRGELPQQGDRVIPPPRTR